MERLTANADNLLLGWTYGRGSTTTTRREVRPKHWYSRTANCLPASRSVSRAYPQAVSGTPISFSFDPASAHFHMLYVPNPKVTAPTVIFVPLSVHYRNGYRASVIGGMVLSHPDATHLVVANDQGVSSVSVSITPVP